MDVIRRNTDYALRIMVNLASNYMKGSKTSRQLSQEEEVSGQLTSKLLQTLKRAGFVKSTMGAKGGFELAKPPSEIAMLEVVAAVQGPITLNRCVLGKDKCPRQGSCPMTAKLNSLQQTIEASLRDVSMEDLAELVKEN
ncbi:RrF2 family transcriptional regulator [Sedimentisphaera salicampi]|uniref:RrF2 family transcriptional regulator n=1 Tax=Sedimentisphaera salicampi TaxID=1941349 RepID=UPI000B9B8DC0|nr:Rrf2 family transcriptional regulator [Sedimentisphaera salicampi]OXU15470.1 Cysteine metabolism repressor [Sedimentisphaera salicampi]